MNHIDLLTAEPLGQHGGPTHHAPKGNRLAHFERAHGYSGLRNLPTYWAQALETKHTDIVPTLPECHCDAADGDLRPTEIRAIDHEKYLHPAHACMWPARLQISLTTILGLVLGTAHRG